MINPRSVFAVLLGSSLACAEAQSLNTTREIEKARKETFPRSVRAILENTDAKVELDVDASSFGDDEKAWGNLYIIANRVVGALGEVGKDQVGKDALAKSVKKVVIVKTATEIKEDTIDLKEGTLTVNTSATDNAMALLQGVITRGLEKALGLGSPTPEK